MRHPPLLRIAALVVAMLPALSGQLLALAHGHAHHEAQEHADHDREHHHAMSESSAHAVIDAPTPSIGPSGGSGDHGHPELSPALSARADVLFFVIAPSPSFADFVMVRSRASLPLPTAPPRAGPHDESPRQPRAPPLG